MAYFLMPPVFSLHVSRTSDLVALGFYGIFGLVVAKSATSRQKRIVVREEPTRNVAPIKQPEADVLAAMAEMMSSDLGVRLHAADITVDVCVYRITMSLSRRGSHPGRRRHRGA